MSARRCGCGGRLGYSLRREADVCMSCPAQFPRAPTMEDLKYLDRSIAGLREHRLALWRDMADTTADVNEQLAYRKKLARKIQRSKAHA